MSSRDTLAVVEPCVRSTFFDALDEEELALIIQWATCLCSFTYNNLVHPPDHMFDANGPFFPVIAKMYSRLMISNVTQHFLSPMRAGVLESVVISPLMANRLNVFSCFGPMLKAVRIVLYETKVDYHQKMHLVRNMLRSCKDLKSLKFCRPTSTYDGDVVCRLVTGFAYNLEEILISGMPGLGFRLSNLAFPKLKSLSVLLLVKTELDDIILLLQSVGDSLEKIRLTNGPKAIQKFRQTKQRTEKLAKLASAPASKWRELFDVMRVKCTKLYSIFMFGDELPKEDYEQLLISYGPQIRYAGFKYTWERSWGRRVREEFESMSRVAPQCPNVEFKVVVESANYDDSFIRAMNRLAPHITEILLDLRDNNTNFEALESFANQMNKLKAVYARRVTAKTLHAIFATPKHSLEQLDLNCQTPSDLSLNHAVAGKLRSSVSNLWLLKFNIAGRKDVELYASLIPACSNLRRVGLQIVFPCSNEEFVDHCNRLLRAVCDCQKLEFVDIRGKIDFVAENENEERIFRNGFIDAQSFRLRNVRIRIQEIEMFPPSSQVLFNDWVD